MDINSITIRKAEAKDALGIAIVQVYTWKTTYTGLIADKAIDARISGIYKKAEQIEKDIENGKHFIIAECKGTVIGFAFYDESRNADYSEDGEICAMYVLQGFQNNGIGKMLFENCVDELKSIGHTELIVNCIIGNPFIGFYEKMGGTIVGQRKDEIAGGDIIEENIIRFSFNEQAVQEYVETERDKQSKLVAEKIDMLWAEMETGEAFLQTGLALKNGEMGEEERIYAWKFIKEAAEKYDNTAAMHELGECYRWGEGGVYAEPDEAIKWYRAAMEKGDEKAAELVERFDTRTGKNAMLLAAMSGPDGQGTRWYRAREGVESHYKQAKAGNIECQCQIAQQRINPENYGPFKYDPQEAVYWYTEAAKEEDLEAMFNLALIYFSGVEGLVADKMKAKRWFTKCADLGERQSRYILDTPEYWQ